MHHKDKKMQGQLYLLILFTFIPLIGVFLLFYRRKISLLCLRSCTPICGIANEGNEAINAEKTEGSDGKKTKHKKNKQIHKNNSSFHHDAAHKHNNEQKQADIRSNELFVDFVKGVNKSVDAIAIAPHAALIASATPDGKLHISSDTLSYYFFTFHEDSFSALDFCCSARQQQHQAFLCAAMATEGRLVCFEIKLEDKKITGMKEIHRSKKPLQRGFVAELVASKGPWIVTRSEGEDTEIRVHSYEGDLLAVLDTKQIRNFQLSVSDDGCLFGCAAWSPGVKIYNVKEKGGNFQKVEKALDVPTSSGSIAFCISPDQRRAAVLNKNNNLSTWRLDVRHQAGEDTKMVAEKDVHLSDQGATTLHYSRDGSVIIAACGCSLYLFNAEDLQLIRAVEHLTAQPIERLLVAPNNKFILLCVKGLRPAILRLPLGK